MAQFKRRPQLRDDIRHLLGKVTLYDLTKLASDLGEAAPHQPEPNNNRINEAITNAVSRFNRRLFATTGSFSHLTRSVSGQTEKGPLVVSLTDGWSGQTGHLSIMQVRRVSWVDSQGTSRLLIPTSYVAEDRDGRSWENDEPSTPERWWVEGMLLFIHPAPDTAGTIRIMVGQAIVAPESDSEGIEYIPTDFASIIEYMSVQELALQSPHDAEMNSIAAGLEARIQEGLMDGAIWVNQQSRPYQPRIKAGWPRRWRR